MNRIGKTGRKAERLTAKRLGGRETRASGNMVSDKGDIELDEFLIENKATEQASYGLKHELLCKISKEALIKGKSPAFAIQYVHGSGSPKAMGSWVAIPEYLFKELMELKKEHG